jgi:putative PIN family toxin of toxin-antitoxin system
VVTTETLSEIHRVVKRIQAKGYSVNFKPYLELLAIDCDICEPCERIKEEDVVRDPDDNMFIHCALESGVKVIVSGDKDLLTLRNYQDIQIYSPREFYEMFLA